MPSFIKFGLGSGGGDKVPPVVAFISPPAGHAVGKNEPIVLEVTDNKGELAKVLITVSFANSSTTEVMFNGSSFLGAYANSSREAITNGWRFMLRRRGGWTGSPTVEAHVIDQGGNLS